MHGSSSRCDSGGILEGILIDAYVKDEHIVLWIHTEGRLQRFEDRFSPTFYAVPNERLLNTLLSERVHYTFRARRDFTTQKEIKVAVITPCISRFTKLVRYLENTSGFTYELFNADIPPEQMYFFEKDIFPLCTIRFTHEDGRITSIENIDTATFAYTIPPLKKSAIRVTFEDDIRKGFHIPVTSITIDGMTIAGPERELLQRFAESYAAADADIILVDDGDSVIPHVSFRMSLFHIPFTFGRDSDTFAAKDGKNYFSYGRVLYKKHAIYLRGRLHIDTSTFLYREGELAGCFELSRTCAVPIQRMSRQSPGSGISNLQVKYAYHDYLIPYKKNQTERYKTCLELFLVDKGGIILEPRTGFHQDITELDFASMYPSIMVKYNISPETLFCDCCEKNTPLADVHTCKKREGLIPKILRPIIARRKYCKAHPTPENLARAKALKWILVTCFGYMGFRHAKFGRIEAHEAINAHSRNTLLSAIRIAESMDFAVIHGIVDSLWVKKKGATDKEVRKLAQRITEETGLSINIEGRYRWIVFLPSVAHTDLSVPSRFYGVFSDGTLKCRGIDIRRRDSPPIVKKLQEEQLKLLKRARTKQAFDEAMMNSVRLLKRAIAQISGRKEDLIIRKHISKLTYSASCAQKIILEKHNADGLFLHPGEAINYVIRDAHARHPTERFSTDNARIDVDAYRELLIRSTANLFLPFGLTRERLDRMTRNEQQLSLFDCFVEWKTNVIPYVLERVQRRVGEYG